MFKKKKADNFETQNWYKDRHQWLSIWRNIMVVFSLLCLGASILFGSAIYAVLPHKSVEPFVIQIDQKSGITERVDQFTTQEMTANEALKKYFIVKYIRARETWDVGGWNEFYNYNNYLTTSYMSKAASQALNEYNEQISPSNADSFYNKLGQTGSRTITFKNITFNGSNAATIRAYVEQVGSEVRKVHLTINLEFEFVKLDMTQEQSYINPLGFLVKTYRVIEEVVDE